MGLDGIAGPTYLGWTGLERLHGPSQHLHLTFREGVATTSSGSSGGASVIAGIRHGVDGVLVDVGDWGNAEQRVEGDENVMDGDVMCEERKRLDFDLRNLLYSW